MPQPVLKKHHIRIIIIAMVVGEAYVLVHDGWLRREYTGGFLIVATWVKDALHTWLVRE